MGSTRRWNPEHPDGGMEGRLERVHAWGEVERDVCRTWQGEVDSNGYIHSSLYVYIVCISCCYLDLTCCMFAEIPYQDQSKALCEDCDCFVSADREKDVQCMSAAFARFAVACAVFTADYMDLSCALIPHWGVCVCVCVSCLCLSYSVCVCVFSPDRRRKDYRCSITSLRTQWLIWSLCVCVCTDQWKKQTTDYLMCLKCFSCTSQTLFTITECLSALGSSHRAPFFKHSHAKILFYCNQSFSSIFYYLNPWNILRKNEQKTIHTAVSKEVKLFQLLG